MVKMLQKAYRNFFSNFLSRIYKFPASSFHVPSTEEQIWLRGFLILHAQYAKISNTI